MDRFFRNFSVIFAREFRETLRTRFFRFLSVIFGLIILLAALAVILLHALPSEYISSTAAAGTDYAEQLIGITPDQTDELEKYVVVVDDRTGGTLLARLAELTPLVEYTTAQLSSETLREAFSSGADGCLLIRSTEDMIFYLPPDDNPRLNASIQSALTVAVREQALSEFGLSPEQAAAIVSMEPPLVFSPVSFTDIDSSAPENGGGFNLLTTGTGSAISVFLISTLLYSSISFYGMTVSSRVSSEKSSRMIEVLANSASPVELLCGKVMGVGTAGFIQVTAFYSLLLLLAASALNRLTEFFPFAGEIFAEIISSAAGHAGYVFLYLLLGFFQLAFAYGCIGAMSADRESVSGFAALPLHLPAVGYFISMLAPYISGSALLAAASYMPLVAPFAMPARLGVEAVAPWEVILSAAIQLAAIVLTAIIAARLYRSYMLRYGQPPRLKEIFQSIFSRTGQH